MQYPNVTPVPFDQDVNGRAYSLLRAALVIGGGSALLWGLIVYAVWQIV